MGRSLRNVFTFLWLICCLVFPRAAAAQTSLDWTFPGDKIEETEGRGLMLRSNPVGAWVYIDGIERGRTPLHLANLRTGVYFVQIIKEGYSERRFRVSVRPGSVMDISLELQEAVGRVLLKINPGPGSPGPDKLPLEPLISVDGQSFRGPVIELPVGFRTIHVRAFGWEDVSETLFIEEETVRELELSLKPAPFTLSGAGISRARFNPANAGSLGTTTVNFEVSAPGKGTLTVLDPEGETVFFQSLGPFETWPQSAVWNGRNMRGEILPDGKYTLIVKASPLPRDDSAPQEDSLAVETALDSSRVINPLTISSGKSGLLFAPLPVLLPPGSFQIEGSLLAGYPPESGGAWESLPFAAAFRFSPLERLELSAALNVIPHFRGGAGAGVAGGAKWAYLASGDEFPLTAAAGLVFSWTGKTGLTPFGMASGIELFFPFMVDLGKFFSIALSPAVLWTGDEGFPWEPIPRLLVSGGLIFQKTYFTAGLSIRSEYNFDSADPLPPPLMIGGEIKFMPPPSMFVFSVTGGVWTRDGNAGGFGGIGIGMIH